MKKETDSKGASEADIPCTSRPTGQRTVVSTQNLTKVADERSYGTMMTSETYLMPLTMT